MPTATIAGRPLSYTVRGEGDPLLLIMGMSGSQHHWGEPFLAELERDMQVITFDHRGVGDSAPLEGAITIAEMAEDAAALLGGLGFERADVLGISMGGMVAQELALAHPRRVRTLTLGCTYAGGPDSALTEPAVVLRLQESMLSGDRERAIRTAFEVNTSSSYAARQDRWEAFHQVALRGAVAVPVIMAQMQAIAAHDTSARLASITAPTLVIHGTEDLLLPVSNAHAIAAAIPGAHLEILDGVGHLFFWERPEEAAALVVEHARREGAVT